MTSAKQAVNFDESLGCLIASDLRDLAARLDSIQGLHASEPALILAATRDTLLQVLRGKLSRLLLLELNAARVNGQLQGADSESRWAEFMAVSSRYEFWDGLSVHYPTLLQRVGVIVRNRCASALTFAQGFADDRHALGELGGGPLGELESLGFGAGDSHRGGKAVVLVHCQGGRVVYKPRSVAIDAELRRFVLGLPAGPAGKLDIDVPRVLDRGEYGWTEFIGHRYADGADELHRFYRGIGQWLAIMRLLGGSDLHAENLIAQGARPVIVDCETWFTPKLKPIFSGMGLAFDRAVELVNGTVLSMGLLPGRGAGLGWRGVDTSGVGSLPGQQPMMPQPAILNAGSDEAHLGSVMVEAPVAQNHPSASPALAEYWPDVLHGFDALTAVLRALDDASELAPMLDAFSACEVRVVTRATEVYAELARMLWHPVSLHKQAEAEQRAHDLLARMAENILIAPSDAAVIEAEIADLLEGDVPFFTTSARHGQLESSRGVRWLPPADLIEASLRHWRQADLVLERQVIQATLVSAYVNDGWVPPAVSLRSQQPRTDNLDVRRRQQAAQIMRQLVSERIAGADGTATWIASVMTATGRSVQPLSQDVYGGISGIAVLVAAYRREMEAGRADAVAGLDDLLHDLLNSMRLANEQYFSRRLTVKRARPPNPGGYLGLGSQIWAWLTLEHWGATEQTGIEQACALADLMPEAIAADTFSDVLAGNAGAIVPLIMLARASHQPKYLAMAIEAGDRLCASAQRKDGMAYWTHERWPQGLGGFAHGASGVGWALAKLAQASGETRFAEMSAAALAFEDSLFDAQEQNWLDLRGLGGDKAAAAWCHGAVGIGLALTDLHPGLADAGVRSKLRVAAETTWRCGMGLNHGVCHGDMGAWEWLETAIRADLGPAGLDREQLLASIVSSLEEHGPTCGLTSNAFSPGLVSGLGGVVYQLLRAHPASRLPSVMIMDGEAFLSTTKPMAMDTRLTEA